MDDNIHAALPLHQRRSRARRLLLALAFVGAATGVRFAFEPLLHGHAIYIVFVAAVVFATWSGDVLGGIVASAAGMLAAEYFFAVPHYQLSLRPQNVAAMAMFAGLSAGLVWVVGRWRRAEDEVRDLQAQAEAVVQHLPVGVFIVDASGRLIFGNPAGERIAGHPFVPTATRDYWQQAGFRVLHPDGRPVEPEEVGSARALKGETVRDEEVRMVWPDGTRKTLSATAAPIRRADGNIAGAVVAIIDITAQKETAEAARQHAEELQTILDTVPAAVFIAEDPEARRVAGNRFTTEVLHLPVGTNMSMTPNADAERPTTFRFVRDGVEIPGDELPLQVAASRGVEVRGIDLDLAYADGRVRTLFGNANPLRDAAGLVRGAVGAFVDVSDRRAAEDALREANRLKDEFLATLSHELRTPLNAIVGWSDMLRRRTLRTDQASKAMESVYRNATTLAEMINDVLDVSRIISGKVRIEMQPVDPVAVLQSAVESVRSAADAKGVTIMSDCAPVPFPVSGDPTRLQQVFWNLLVNAVKFTPTGGQIAVTSQLTGDEVEVQVRDTGIGINAEFLPHVFERFRQRDSSTTRPYSGLGLGLAIVRHLVEMHGGTVEASSAGEERGATFTVRLPAQRFQDRRRTRESVARPVPAVELASGDTPGLCGARVLVVDDQREAREVAASVLQHHGASVEVAANAEQALEQFTRFDPNVLLIDLAMPDVDGYGLIERIRRTGGEKGKSVPAIAFTAYARDEDQRRALAHGFQLHLAKPVDSQRLVRAVASVQTPGSPAS